MKLFKKYPIIISAVLSSILAWLFCTEPTTPDFTAPTIGNTGQIQTFGKEHDGASFGMFITVKGTEPFTFKWLKNDTAISGSNNDSLKFNPLTTYDNGDYQCVVSNNKGVDTSLVYTLDAVVSPEIITDPQDKSITVGDSATFSIVATGTALNFQWQKDNSDISGDTNSSLTTPASSLTDSGSQYRCIISNSAGSDTSNIAVLSVTVNVVKPEITKDPENKSITVGDSATFTVSATGTAPLSYQWQKDTVNISGATDSSYTTPAATPADSGSQYRCVVSNSAGSDTSNVAILSVTVNDLKPEITKNPQDKSIAVGDSVTFTISATGTAPLSFQWQKDTVNISGATDSSYTTPAATMADSGSQYRW